MIHAIGMIIGICLIPYMLRVMGECIDFHADRWKKSIKDEIISSLDSRSSNRDVNSQKKQ